MAPLRTAWRSWFQNIVLALVLMAMAGISIGIVFNPGHPFFFVLFIGISAVMCAGVVRSFLLGVFAKPRGIVLRGLTHTTTIPWGEIEEITGARMQSGAAGIMGATAPVVVRRGRDGRKGSRIELNVVGNYSLSPVRPTPADLAIADLNAHLTRWRQAHEASAGH